MKNLLLLSVVFLSAFNLRGIDSPQPLLRVQEIENQVLKELNDGRQDQAETLLETSISQGIRNQRVLFLQAACARSRFMIEEALPLFVEVAKMDATSPAGQCAKHIENLDKQVGVEENFSNLVKLIDANPEDIILRWMLAVQCRSLDKNEIGAEQFGKILQKWSPGPVLVHQSYGNILDELKRYDAALIERRKAVELEPAGWSYQGLGNTLTALKKFDEAESAYAKSVELAPEGASYWRSWAWGLERQNKFDEAIIKCQKAVELNPREFLAWSIWGDALISKGLKQEALEKYKMVLKLNPSDKWAKKQIQLLINQK